MKTPDKIISVAGVLTGRAAAVDGQSTAMGIATTFGTASTGTAISTLPGATATNAATARLGPLFLQRFPLWVVSQLSELSVSEFTNIINLKSKNDDN